MSFVAINYITCEESYFQRFEELFRTRAKAIDRLSGFVNMEVLKPQKPDEPYLVVSHWENQECFDAWLKSPEFVEGHKRAFEDMRIAKEKGEQPPMHSKFLTYSVLAR